MGFAACLVIAVLLAVLLPQPAASIDGLPIPLVPIVALAGFLSIPVWAPILSATRGSAAVQRTFICICSALFWSISAGALYKHLNMILDDLPPQSETLVVERKYLVARSSTPGRLHCSFGNHESFELAVPREKFESIQVGARLTAFVHGGAFGLRWISGYSQNAR